MWAVCPHNPDEEDRILRNKDSFESFTVTFFAYFVKILSAHRLVKNLASLFLYIFMPETFQNEGCTLQNIPLFLNIFKVFLLAGLRRKTHGANLEL